MPRKKMYSEIVSDGPAPILHGPTIDEEDTLVAKEMVDAEWDVSLDWNTFVMEQFRRMGAGKFTDFRFLDTEHKTVCLRFSKRHTAESGALDIRHEFLDCGLYLFRFGALPDVDRYYWWYFYIATNSNFRCEYFAEEPLTEETKELIWTRYEGVEQEIQERQKGVCKIVSEFLVRDICQLIAGYEYGFLNPPCI